MSKDDSEPPKVGPTYINPNKKYGLIIPNKATLGGTQLKSKLNASANSKTLVKPCIFYDDEDDDDEEKTPFKNEKKHIAATNTSANRIKKETQLEIEKALSVDPNVFEYDEIYDKLEEEKAKMNPKLKNKNESKEPKYIAGIMKAAAKRKMEFEKLQERKIQTEREKEGDLWNDKEVFVTSAYRKKMEERQLLEEEERRQDQIESLLDVRKAKDLSGFYSNILKIRSGEMVIEEEGEKDKRLEKETKTQKHYRVKQDSSDEENEVQKDTDTNLDKEQNMTLDEEKHDKPKEENQEKDVFKEPFPKKSKDDEVKIEDQTSQSESKPNDDKENQEPALSKEEKNRLRREKLFTKRTVGDKLDQEIAEYFIRKSQFLSSKSYIEKE